MAERIVDSNGNVLVINTDGSINTTASGTDQEVVGNVASGAADSGNPVKVGGKYNATAPTFADGERGDLQLQSRGGLKVGLTLGNGNTAVGGDTANAVGDAYSLLSFIGLNVLSLGYAFNGATVDRWRGNNNGTVLASAARTATSSSADLTNYNNRGAHIVVDVTALADTPSVVFTVEGRDALSGKYYTLLTSAAIVGTGTTVLKVYPSVTAVANVAVSDILPRTWRVTATHGDADSITYSVGYSLVL